MLRSDAGKKYGAVAAAIVASAFWVATAWAQTEGGGDGGQLPFWMAQPFLIISMLLIFYFLMIRPHQKKQKALQKMIASMKQGDRILTSGGLYGTVFSVKDDVVVVKLNEQVKVELAKSAITSVSSG